MLPLSVLLSLVAAVKLKLILEKKQNFSRKIGRFLPL